MTTQNDDKETHNDHKEILNDTKRQKWTQSDTN